jgi:hypothetical protein
VHAIHAYSLHDVAHSADRCPLQCVSFCPCARPPSVSVECAPPSAAVESDVSSDSSSASPTSSLLNGRGHVQTVQHRRYDTLHVRGQRERVERERLARNETEVSRMPRTQGEELSRDSEIEELRLGQQCNRQLEKAKRPAWCTFISPTPSGEPHDVDSMSFAVHLSAMPSSSCIWRNSGSMYSYTLTYSIHSTRVFDAAREESRRAVWTNEIESSMYANESCVTSNRLGVAPCDADVPGAVPAERRAERPMPRQSLAVSLGARVHARIRRVRRRQLMPPHERYL